MPIPSNPPSLAGVIGVAADVLPIPAQDYTDPTQNGALNYTSGWPPITAIPLEAGGKAPRREYFNALAQLLSSHIFFQQSGSLYPWSVELNYLSCAHVLGSDGKEYIAQKSNGPDVPDSSAVNPVGDESGTWLPAGVVYAPMATNETPGIMRPDGTTCIVDNGVLSVNPTGTLNSWRTSWIGVPRPWRSTTLPPNHCWANGDFISFSDWPELQTVSDSGGFAGMLLPWDADSGTQAANLGMWRPNAALPTGLYTPNLTGKFLQSWTPGSGSAGTYTSAGLPDIGGFASGLLMSVTPDSGGALLLYSPTGPDVQTINGDVNPWGYVDFKASRSNSIYGSSTSVMPESIALPYIIYLGQPA